MDRTERQALGIEKWKASGCRGSCLYPTGFGKTRTALTAVKRFLSKNPKSKVLVVVPTDYLKEQWKEQIREEGLLMNVDVQVINTVVKSSWDVDLLILDELHVYAADTFYEVFENVKYKIIMGLTGTLDRLDGKESLLKEKCPIVDEITMKEAIEYGWLSNYKEYQVLLDVDLTEYNKANQDFINHFAVFNYDFDLAMRCVTGVKFKNVVTKSPHIVRYEYAKSLCNLPMSHPEYAKKVKELNAQVTASTFAWMSALKKRKAFVMSHEKKIEVAQKILNNRPDSKAITFSSTIKDAEKIKLGYVLHSKQTKKKRGLTRDEFDKLETGVLNTSKSLDCGE